MRRVHRGAFSSAALDAALSQHALLSQDRGLVTELVYGTLRREITLNACLEPRLEDPGKLPAEVLDALRIGTYEKLFRETPAHAAVSEWVNIVKRQYPKLAGLVNAVLRRVTLPDDPSPAVRYGLPGWLYEEWLELFGEEAPIVAEEQLTPSPLWLLEYSERARESLELEGAEVRSGPLEGTLEVRANVPLAQLAAYREGLVQPQNPSSTVPARLLEVNSGDYVLDLAGGNGIKAAQLAALGAKVVSVDIHESKARRGSKNLARLGLSAEFLTHDLRQVPPLEPALKVILDTPCSGTGTLRSNPELRTRVTPQTVQELGKLQLELLRTAAVLTAAGGTLVYAVCTLTQAETLAVVRAFLQEHEGFKLEPFRTSLPHKKTPEGQFILPLSGLDGFFVSVLKKT